MESKIEKLKLVNHDLIVDFDRIESKINELIEAHNRYFAPEETETLNITDEKWLEVKEAIENLTKEDLFTWLQDVLVFPEWEVDEQFEKVIVSKLSPTTSNGKEK